MKVTTDACLFGAWVAEEVRSQESGVGSRESGVGSRKSGLRSLLDIGTGTSLLAIMLAQKNPEMKIDAIEIDNDAAEEAKINVVSSPWKEQINIIQDDVKGLSFEKKFDVIISNPPFYENEIRSAIDSKNVAHHSQSLTLKELLAIIKRYLTRDGLFFLLLPYKRNEEIKKLFKDQQLHISKMILARQSLKHDYFRIMIKGSLYMEANKETEFDELSIWNEKQEYTDEFVNLLKDYYLHL